MDKKSDYSNSNNSLNPHNYQSKIECSESLIESCLFPENKSQQYMDTILPHLQNINPHKQVDNSLIKKHAILVKVLQQTEKSPEEVDKLENQSQQMLKQIENNIQSQSSQNKKQSCDLALAGLYHFYRNQGFKVQLQNQPTQQSDQNRIAKTYQSQIILTDQTENQKYLQLKINDTSELSFTQIQQNPKIKNDFIQIFLEAASKAYNVPKEDVQIIDITKGSINVYHYIQGQNQQQMDNNFMKKGINIFKQYFNVLSLDVKSFLDNFQLTPQMFSPNFNMTWDDQKYQNHTCYRGSLPFKSGQKPQKYKLPIGYEGYGLNVDKWLEKDKKWFAMDSSAETWIVLYHGTKSKFVQSIANNGLKAGQNNLYGGQYCRITG